MLFVLANLISGSRRAPIGKERVVRFPKMEIMGINDGLLKNFSGEL